MITNRQRSVLSFIVNFTMEIKFAPSVREIAAGVGLRSPGSVTEILRRLEQRGMVRKLPGSSRASEVLRKPEDIIPQ